MATTTIATPTDPALTEHAAAIRALRSRIVNDVAETGRRLTEVKRIVGHGNWLPWLEHEFGWSEDTAERFTRVHQFVEGLSNSASVRNLVLTLPVSSVYLLAAPSTPKEARDEIVERAEAGEPVTGVLVRKTIKAAKQPAKRNLTLPKPNRITPERIEQIKNLVERGKSREQIAEIIGCTPGSLAVTCSRLGISLRRPKLTNGVAPALAPVRATNDGADAGASKDALIEQLRAQVRRLEIKIAELKALPATLEGRRRLFETMTLPEALAAMPAGWIQELEQHSKGITA